MIHIFAQDAAAPTQTFILWGALIVVFYLFFIRPQQRRNRRQQDLMRSLEIGDNVRTAGGILGVVISLDETEIVLGVEEGRIRLARAAIQSRIEPETEPDPADES